jgi:hypothetical protein
MNADRFAAGLVWSGLSNSCHFGTTKQMQLLGCLVRLESHQYFLRRKQAERLHMY